MIPPENPDFIELKFGGRVYYGRAKFEKGMRAGVEPLAIRIELPPGHGDCPTDWFYMRHTSEVNLLTKLQDGFIPDELWLECYRQAWLNLKHKEKG